MKKYSFILLQILLYLMLIYELFSYGFYKLILNYSQEINFINDKKSEDSLKETKKIFNNIAIVKVPELKEKFLILGVNNNSIINEFIFTSTMVSIRENYIKKTNKDLNDFEFNKFKYIFENYKEKGLLQEERNSSLLNKNSCYNYFYKPFFCNYFYKKDKLIFDEKQENLKLKIKENNEMLDLNEKDFINEIKQKKLIQKYKIVV